MLEESAQAKVSLKKGALVKTRRALRSASDKIPELISTLLNIAKTNQTPLRLVGLLGVAISVLIRLKDGQDEPVQRLSQELKQGVTALYINIILMTKFSVPHHAIVSSCKLL